MKQGRKDWRKRSWHEAVNTFEQDKGNFESFVAIMRKYLGITELTPTIVNEFAKKIIVQAAGSSGLHREKIQFVWNLFSEVKLPHDNQTIERQRKSKTAQPFSYAALGH